MHPLVTKPVRLSPGGSRAAAFAHIRSDESRRLWFWGPADAKGRACEGEIFGPYPSKLDAWRAAEAEGCRVNTYPLRATIEYRP